MGNLARIEAIDLIQRLEMLASSAREHPVFANRFYDLWTSEKLDHKAFEIFRQNYGFRVGATVGRISRALLTIDNVDARIRLWENLGDELGHGDANRVHIRIFDIWSSELSRRLSGFENGVSDFDAPVLPTTKRFVDETNAMCETDPATAAGAILAQEWHGYAQIAFLYDGYLLYRDLFDGEEFHDLAEYFYVHIGTAEKEHQVQALEICKIICTSDSQYALIEAAFFKYLDLLNDFWTGVHHAVATVE